MTATITVYVENVDEVLTSTTNPYTAIRTYRFANPSDTIASATLVATTALVAGTRTYIVIDAGGSIASLYRNTFYNTSPAAESGLGEIIRPSATTLRMLRREAARHAGAGFDGVCSGDGTTTTVVDAALRDTGIDDGFLEGAWIYRPDAAVAGDKVRRVRKDGFASANGALSFDRAYTNAPASGEAYEVYNFFPPVDQPGSAYSWDRAVRDGLAIAWFVNQVDLGPGTATRDNRFSLATFPDINARTWRRVFLRTTNSDGGIIDTSCHTNGRYVVPVTNGAEFSLDIFPAPPTTQNVIVEALRTDDGLYADTDTTNCPANVAIRAAVLKAYARLQLLQPGKYAGEYAAAMADWQEVQTRHQPHDMVVSY